MIRVAHISGLERMELKRLTARITSLCAALQEAAEVEAPFGAGAWSPPVDLCETPNALQVRVELPGVSADQIRIGLTDGHLRIDGEKRRIKSRRRNVSHLCSERSYGRFGRIVPLRWTICVKEATAELSNGVLLVHLPKLKDRQGAEFKVPIREI